MTCMVQWIQWMQLVLMSRHESNTEAKIMRKCSEKTKQGQILKYSTGHLWMGGPELREMKWDGKSWELQLWKAKKNEWRRMTKCRKCEMKRGVDRGNKWWEGSNLYLKLRQWVPPQDNWEETWSYSPLLPSPGNTHTSAHYCTPTAWTGEQLKN